MSEADHVEAFQKEEIQKLRHQLKTSKSLYNRTRNESKREIKRLEEVNLRYLAQFNSNMELCSRLIDRWIRWLDANQPGWQTEGIKP